MTNEQGAYDGTPIQAIHYQVTVTASGFESKTVNGVAVGSGSGTNGPTSR